LLPSLKRTPQDSRRADSYPDQSGKRRAKSPSHIGEPFIRARKTMPLEPNDQLAVHFLQTSPSVHLQVHSCQMDLRWQIVQVVELQNGVVNMFQSLLCSRPFKFNILWFHYCPNQKFSLFSLLCEVEMTISIDMPLRMRLSP